MPFHLGKKSKLKEDSYSVRRARSKNMKMLPFFTFVLLLTAVDAGPKKCKGEDNNTYSIGKGYTKGCTMYICKKMGRRLKMVKQTSPNCCQYKGKLYQPGEEIESTALGECSQKLIKCTSTSRGAEAQTVLVHGNCCNFNGKVLLVGERVALPQKCEWAVCGQVMNETTQELVPTLQIDVAHDSCHCCLGEDGDLYENGEIVELTSGLEGVCCGGQWADAINVTSTETSDLVLTGGNNWGPLCFENSTLLQKESVCKPNIPDLPHDINGAQSIWFNNMLWNCGGQSDGHRPECYTYTPGMVSWHLNSNMTKGRYGFGLTILSDDTMIATGGTFRGHEITNTMEIYSKERGTWEQTSFNMSKPRYRHCALYYNKFVVVISGYIGTSSEPYSTEHAKTDSVEQLDIGTGTWTQLSPLPKGLAEHACALMEEEGESVIYVSGGHEYDRTAVYKYTQNNWVVAGHLNRPRHGHTMGVGRGRLVVAGGVHYYGTRPNGTNQYYTSVEMMSKGGDWTEWDNGLEVARYAHSMAKVPLHTFNCV